MSVESGGVGGNQNKSVEFFDSQFRRQVQAHDYKLNPFESRALDYLAGTVLDLGCGLGNLALEAARRGHSVVAVDASSTAVARIEAAAEWERLPIREVQADLTRWEIDWDYTTIVAIGLLMFFRRERALELLRDIQSHVEPGGRAIVNVLVEGTTFMGMFQPGGYYLFGRDELEEHFAGWEILSSVAESFPAPGDTRKDFTTVTAVLAPYMNQFQADEHPPLGTWIVELRHEVDGRLLVERGRSVVVADNPAELLAAGYPSVRLKLYSRRACQPLHPPAPLCSQSLRIARRDWKRLGVVPGLA